MLPQESLTKEQKEAVKLLSIGTFLEYFDLMLYVHMAVLLNDLFFPKHDSSATPLLSSFAFCSIFLLRPIGALIFGWVGDTIGRKKTVIITTMMMAFSCITMAVLPTYAQIGIIASWLMTLCRMVQSISSMEEIIGAEIYLTETIKSTAKYPAVALLSLFSVLGGFGALAVSSLVMSSGFNWRIAFWVGAVIAVVGFAARTKLRETPDFADAKRKYNKMLKELDHYRKNKNNIVLIKIFDRLHNMQTINFKSIKKQQKIALETIIHIVPLAMSLGIRKIEDLLTDICLQVMNTPKLQMAYSEAELKKKAQKILLIS